MADLLTVNEAAAYLKMAAETVRALCPRSRPVIAHHRVGPRGGRILISREECDRYLRRTLVSTASSDGSAPKASPARPKPAVGYQHQYFVPGTRQLIDPRKPSS